MATCTFAVGTADTGGTPNTSGAFTPALNDLLVVFVQAAATTQATAALTSSLGGGFTFTQFTSVFYSGATHALYGFVANQLVSSATSQTVAFDTSSDPATGTIIFVFRVSGITRTGLDAILQSDTDTGASSTTPGIDFPSSALTGNPTLVAMANQSNTAGVTPPTNWTENASGDLGYSNPTMGAECAHRNSGFTGTAVDWASTSATAWGAIGVEIDSSTAAQIISVGLVEEADSAFAVGKLKLKAVGLNSETDSVLALTKAKAMAVGLNTEADSVLALTRVKTLAVGLTDETDAALPLVGAQIVAVGLSEETDSVLALTPVKTMAVGLPTESDSASAVASKKDLALGLTTETDTALAVTRVRVYTLGLAEETDEVLALAANKLKVLGLATETDTAMALEIAAVPFLNPWYEGKTVYPLSDVTGLTEWADYIPVEAIAVNVGRYDNDGSFPVVQVLTNIDGLTAWADYIPVYVVSRSIPWSTEADGYIPIEDV
jgi:hypothetical protein